MGAVCSVNIFHKVFDFILSYFDLLNCQFNLISLDISEYREFSYLSKILCEKFFQSSL